MSLIVLAKSQMRKPEKLISTDIYNTNTISISIQDVSIIHCSAPSMRALLARLSSLSFQNWWCNVNNWQWKVLQIKERKKSVVRNAKLCIPLATRCPNHYSYFTEMTMMLKTHCPNHYSYFTERMRMLKTHCPVTFILQRWWGCWRLIVLTVIIRLQRGGGCCRSQETKAWEKSSKWCGSGSGSSSGSGSCINPKEVSTQS